MKKSTKKTAGSTKRYRAVVTPQLRKQAVAMMKSGEIAATIAERLKVSIATVYNLKKAAGLVKSRRPAKKARKK